MFRLTSGWGARGMRACFVWPVGGASVRTLLSRPAMVEVLTFLKRKAGMSVEDFRKGELAYDGIAVVWADGAGAQRATTRSSENARVQADETNFIDRATLGFVVAEERVIVEGAVGAEAVKVRILGLRHDSSDALRAATTSSAYATGVADRSGFLTPGEPPFIVTREHVSAPRKLFRRGVISPLTLETTGFELDHQISAKVLARGDAIKEVPIRCFRRSREEGKKIGARDWFRALKTLTRYRNG
jgi:hypothetical protein